MREERETLPPLPKKKQPTHSSALFCSSNRNLNGQWTEPRNQRHSKSPPTELRCPAFSVQSSGWMETDSLLSGSFNRAYGCESGSGSEGAPGSRRVSYSVAGESSSIGGYRGECSTLPSPSPLHTHIWPGEVRANRWRSDLCVKPRDTKKIYRRHFSQLANNLYVSV